MANLNPQTLDSDLRKFTRAGYDNNKPRRLNHLDGTYWTNEKPLTEPGQLVYLFMNTHDHDQCFSHVDTGRLRQLVTQCIATMNQTTNLVINFNSRDSKGRRDLLIYCRDYILRQIQEVDSMKCDP